ncbi:MAG: transcriptional regulator, Fis family [Pseudomonadota bacterium]|jgi:Fis family transcriptional regulator
MKSIHATNTTPADQSPSVGQAPVLDKTLLACLDLYFEHLGDQKPHPIHEMVIQAIEPPLLRYALDKCHGNLSKTADLLGLSRNTLRKKLSLYQIKLES